jgi:nitrogen fixation NifU-like protein
MNYSSAVLARVRAPKFAGALPRDEANVGTGEAGSMDEGTFARIQIRVGGDGRISDAVFKVFGCSAAIASASWVTEQLQGAGVSRVEDLEVLTVVAELQLPMERAQVAGLVVRAAKAALADWQAKQRR